MNSRRTKNFRNNLDRTILDKQVDKFFEKGRQLVDGVSGARPGKRRNSDFQGITRRNVKNVGRWVTEKMDLFFDAEDDDWYEENDNTYEEAREIKSFRREKRSFEDSKVFSKRPLEALSLRQPKNVQINEPKKLPFGKSSSFDEWPDDSDLKIDRWQRFDANNKDIEIDVINQRSGLSKSRSLPKSRRRRM